MSQKTDKKFRSRPRKSLPLLADGGTEQGLVGRAGATNIHNLIVEQQFEQLDRYMSHFCVESESEVQLAAQARYELARSPLFVATTFLHLTGATDDDSNTNAEILRIGKTERYELGRAGSALSAMLTSTGMIRHLSGPLIMLFFRALLRLCIIQLSSLSLSTGEGFIDWFKGGNIGRTAACMCEFFYHHNNICDQLSKCALSEIVVTIGRPEKGCCASCGETIVENTLDGVSQQVIWALEHDSNRQYKFLVGQNQAVRHLFALQMRLFRYWKPWNGEVGDMDNPDYQRLPQDQMMSILPRTVHVEYSACFNRGAMATSRQAAQSLIRACGSCAMASYCSKACAASHWKNGHKETCSRMLQPDKPLRNFADKIVDDLELHSLSGDRPHEVGSLRALIDERNRRHELEAKQENEEIQPGNARQIEL